MTTHELKSWPDFFESLFNGSKTFDLRLNDRDCQVGDVLHLREWDDRTQQYTGRECFRRITYVFDGIGWGSITPCKGLARGYAILSLVTSDGGPSFPRRRTRWKRGAPERGGTPLPRARAQHGHQTARDQGG